MHLTDSIVIRAAPDDVWAALDDEQFLREWNPKVVDVSGASAGPRRVGYQYQLTFEMKGRRSRMRAVVVERRPPTQLAIRLEPFDRRGPTATERYALAPDGDGRTRLVQTIDLSPAGVPLWARAMIWLVTRVGTPVEKPYLARLKELVEGANR
jgi:uncharacterized protein YndB with AHSA1/START domain